MLFFKRVTLDTQLLRMTFIYVQYRVVHPKSDIGVLYQSSVYSETTWSCNMSYERKFCVLSEYVRLQNVRPLIKSTVLFK